jgi:LPS-assembly lipoprotein
MKVGRTQMRKLLTAACLTGALGLAGCGFQPLYAQKGVISGLAGVDVIAPQGRAGYLMREHLDDALGAGHGAGSPTYRMNLALAETRYPRGVRVDNVATRYEYVLIANYTLTSVASGTVAKKGKVKVELTYDSADQPYSAISAQQDAQDRAAQEAARRIQLEVAAWLANAAG